MSYLSQQEHEVKSKTQELHNDAREEVPWMQQSDDPEISTFNSNGFIGPITLYDPEEAHAMLSEIRIANQNRDHVLYDNDVNYDRHFDISVLSRHIGHPNIIRFLRKILGNDLLSWRTEFFPKFPGSIGTEWHQVRNYAYATGQPMLESVIEQANEYLDLTVWTTFTDATQENGCMKFLPGSHKKLYYDETLSKATGRSDEYRSIDANSQFFGYEFQEFKIDPEWAPDESQAVAMPMKAGQCVIFTARCVHGSFPNITKRQTRFAISSRYVPTHVRVYPGWNKFRAHGGDFDLSSYGCVLVSGTDRYGHNRLRTKNNIGEDFPYNAS